MAGKFETFVDEDGRTMRRYLGPSQAASAAREPQRADPDLVAQVESLRLENKRLKAQGREVRLALSYSDRIQELIQKGASRQRAVMTAARENPDGQAAFIRQSNKGADPSLLNRQRKQLSALRQLQADAFEDYVAERVAAQPGLDRRAAIRAAARDKPKLHAAWLQGQTAISTR